jgi:hypothetical protein
VVFFNDHRLEDLETLGIRKYTGSDWGVVAGLSNCLINGVGDDYSEALADATRKANEIGDARIIVHWGGLVPDRIPSVFGKDDVPKLSNGLYRLYWRNGGSSLAAVGRLRDGSVWHAPCNWTDCNKSTDWSGVVRVEPIEESKT